jgi:SAM-dependent methyltransferase
MAARVSEPAKRGKGALMRSSIPLYNALALGYDAHWEAPHRRAYDDLAWEFVQPLLPARPGLVIDAGCGVGRWAARIVSLGHTVVGIEQAPAMAAAARARLQTDRFQLIEGSMDEVELPEGRADLVLALGSLQYAFDPEQMIDRLVRWTRPGGAIAVLVDSLVALVLELLASGKHGEALQRLETRTGTWIQGEESADNHQFDQNRLVDTFRRAGLTGIRARGLLVGASALGRQRLFESLTRDWEGQMALERRLAESSLLADLGKQLLVSGQRMSSASEQDQ